MDHDKADISSGNRRGDLRTRENKAKSIELLDKNDGNGASEFETEISDQHKSNLNSKCISEHVGDDNCEEDDGELFGRKLNGVILQYLEACGLVDSYTTFYDECKASGMLIPSHFKAEIESGISLQDVETLLMHFDQENGDALLELWEVLTGMVNSEENSPELYKITFYIQVYIALIPFRQKMSDETKSNSMAKLKQYFQTQSEACTMDKEMLSLFALPFVPDPETHPVFGNLFRMPWIKKLRSRIKNLARALCAPNKLITRDDSDLAKMFKICSKAIPHEIESSDGEKICIFSNVQPMEFTSGVEIEAPDPEMINSMFSPKHLFQRMNDLIVENESFKAEESKYEKQCSQLLNVSILLAQSLEEAAQGKDVNMDKLRHEISLCLPISMLTNNTEEPRKSQRDSPAGDASYDSDASNSNLLDDDDDVSKKRRPSSPIDNMRRAQTSKASSNR